MIFVMAGLKDNWWIGLPLFLVVLAAYDRLYDAIIGANRSGRATILGIAGLVLFQIVYWVFVFYLAGRALSQS